jgi:hypothetical protein
LRKYQIIIILFFVFVCATAQKARVKNDPAYDDYPLHWGYTLGFNVMEFKVNHNDYLYFKYNNNDGKPIFSDTVNRAGRILHADFANFTPGFQVGMITDMRLGEYFSFRVLPSFIFGQRNIHFFTIRKAGTWIHDSTFHIQKLESSMIDIPLLIKYKAKRINNFRPYLVAGGSAKFDLAPKSKFESNRDDVILLKRLDFYYDLGFGIDYYMPFFKLSTEIKLSTGLLDVLSNQRPLPPKDAYGKSIGSLNSRIIQFSIHIE